MSGLSTVFLLPSCGEMLGECVSIREWNLIEREAHALSHWTVRLRTAVRMFALNYPDFYLAVLRRYLFPDLRVPAERLSSAEARQWLIRCMTTSAAYRHRNSRHGDSELKSTVESCVLNQEHVRFVRFPFVAVSVKRFISAVSPAFQQAPHRSTSTLHFFAPPPPFLLVYRSTACTCAIR